MSEIDALLKEDRSFPPTAEWRQSAQIADPGIYDRAAANLEDFWAGFASELEWMRPWDSVLEWHSPHAKWFSGGKLNISVNCLDRHVRTARRNKAAFVWEGEPGDRRTLTYWDLYRQVCAFANVLKSLGVKRGDRVALYLPLIPELAIAMLACARIGAIHSVVFGGFSSESLRDRINDSECVLFTPTEAIAAARLCLSSRWPIRPFGRRRRYETSSWYSGKRARRSPSRSRKDAITGITA